VSTIASNSTLTENDVVKAVAAHLAARGYRIDRALSTSEQGIDIVGFHERSNRKMYVEAKGGTSSKPATNRFGKGFTPNQAKSHVSVALYCAARLHENAEAENADVALAFPGDVTHRKLVQRISKALQALSVTVYFVGEDHSVSTFAGATSTQQVPQADGLTFSGPAA
jgi:hypothetical protein